MRVIAIDGPAGSGKSTVARRLAERLDLEYLDTGAMYRAVTFAALRRGVDPAEAADVAGIVADLDIAVADSAVSVDGVDATIEIRGPEVTRAVSTVAANPAVRAEMVRRQRAWAAERGGGVIEGRDIGSVVFPDAALKVFLTAAPDVRATRRSREVTDLDYEAVAADLARRDALDQGREASPLTRADGALTVDTTDLDVDDIVDALVAELRSTVAVSGGSRSGMHRGRHGHHYACQSATTPPISGGRVLYGLFRPLFVGFAKVWFRLRVEGAGNVPATGPFILAPVHRSNIDFLVVLICARRRMRYLGKDSLWKPGLRHLWNALGGIPVARGTADRAALQTCIKAIAAGEPLVMFPEGSRQSGPQIQPLFDGPAYVQSRTGAPIVPVGIGGSERAMPKGATFIRPHRITVVIGPPLEAASASAGGGAKARRSATRARTAELVAVLQDLFDRAQEQAGTPNR